MPTSCDLLLTHAIVLVMDEAYTVVRDGAVVYTSKLSSLKRFKNDAREVTEGLECGVGLENFNDVKVGDTIEAFKIVG